MQYITKQIEQQREFYNTQKTKNPDFRKTQLKKLKKLVTDYEKEIQEALQEDLGKPNFESYLAEIEFVLQELRYTLKNLNNWVKPKKVSTPALHFPGKSHIYHEPFGCVLVISPWNYPFHLAIAPAIGAIAAGNSVIIKPSEHAPATALLLEKMINQNFDPGFFRVIQGEVEETRFILEQKFDYIFFTGSTQVGKIIMKAAAEHLTPVTLELGGKSPTIIDSTANLEVSAKRIAWGKFHNAGQTCVAPDYIYVEDSVKDAFLEKLKSTLVDFYGTNTLESPDYGRIVNKRHFDRLNKLLENAEIAFGGQTNRSKNFMSPTILNNVSWDDAVMQEEIFGPILPVLEWNNENDLIQQINERPKPLSLYVFSDNKEFIEKIIRETSSGGVSVNEPLSHITSVHLPFGGVGDSGMGNYHGKYSFYTFSHAKSVMKKPFFPDPSAKYPPFSKINGTMKKILKIIS
ncbi:MAG: aldehyde dehydrogenase [Bacteroidales bacterium]